MSYDKKEYWKQYYQKNKEELLKKAKERRLKNKKVELPTKLKE